MPPRRRQFASDNRSNICPEAWAALAEANGAGHAGSYGDDDWTRRMTAAVRDVFETDCDVHLVFGGIAANCLALAALCQSHHAVICHELAHVATDEVNGPAFFTGGARLLPVPGTDGKLTPAAVAAVADARTDNRFPKPRVLSLTQATEVGTVYPPAEVAALSDVARGRGMAVHMDGARFANAVAHLGCRPADLTWRAGVDVLVFGGTKNGLSAGELVVFFDRAKSAEFAYRAKQAGQVASKMRLLSCQWAALLEGDTWLAHAAHSDADGRPAGHGRVAGGEGGLPGAGERRLRRRAAGRCRRPAGPRLGPVCPARHRRAPVPLLLGHDRGRRRRRRRRPAFGILTRSTRSPRHRRGPARPTPA